MDEFISRREAVKILKIHYTTLYRYADDGKIDQIRTPKNRRLFNIAKYLRETQPNINEKIDICYCRVSSNGQKEDLERQIQYMKDRYPNYEIISDIGSGINFKRKGLIKIINYGIKGKLHNLVIAYKDRLCRIGYELIENILTTYSQTNIIIENNIDSSPEEEVVNDLLQIITVFSARVNGLRSYSKSIRNDKKICKKEEKCY